jgi:hypothetical protein
VSPAKLATARGARSASVVALILAHVLGTAVLQVGYQSGGALTVAGLATLLANALPIVAAATVLGEPVPSGPLGGRRAFGFVAVRAGTFLLEQPDDRAPPSGGCDVPFAALGTATRSVERRRGACRARRPSLQFALRGPWSQSQVRMPERRGVLIATRPAICLSAMQRDPRVMNRHAMRQSDK